MHMRHRLFHLNLKEKLSLLFLTLTIIPFVGIGYYGLHSASNSLSENLSLVDKKDVQGVVNSLQNFFDVIPSDMQFLSNIHALHRYLHWKDIGEPYRAEARLIDVYDSIFSFMVSEKNYRQIQVVDLESQELIRVEYDIKTGQAVNASPLQLTSYKESKYFKHALTLKKSQVYTSDLHLDSYLLGALAKNGKPTIHFFSPIIDQNEVMRAILVVTIDSQSFFPVIQQHKEKKIRVHEGFRNYFVVSQQGQYVYHPDMVNTLQHQFHNKRRFKKDIPDLFNFLIAQSSGIYKKDGYIYTHQTFQPTLNMLSDHQWILIKKVDEREALSEIKNFRIIFIIIVFFISLVVVFIAHKVTNRLVMPLLKINEQLKLLSKGKMPLHSVEYKKADEIGEIITSIKQLKTGFNQIIDQANAIAAGNFDQQIKLLSSEDQLGIALTEMTMTLQKATTENAKQDWLKTGQTELSQKMSGEQDIILLSRNIITFLCNYLGIQVGTFYILNQSDKQNSLLKLVATYAYMQRKHLANKFAFGEGLVGQSALEKQRILITDVPEDYIHIQSSLGEKIPRNILVIPFFYEDQVKGIVELGTLREFTDIQIDFIEQVMPSIGVVVNSTESRGKVEELLRQSQIQTEELQTQSEELQTQQEELTQTNTELEKRTQDLEMQKERIRQKNSELEKTQVEIEEKAQELELASKYKSEFLANMSHELRTPLNSLLILAQLLGDNKTNNLTDKQIEYAKTIHSSGSDLLSLINEILDLSKVEAGKIELRPETVYLTDLMASTQSKFQHVADEKHLTFNLTLAENLPKELHTDIQRLKQIINNLLSNAFKFTQAGEIKLTLQRPSPQMIPTMLKLPPAKTIMLVVSDTGIGIPHDKQKVIFEAFQQADGTTSRKYGGTGLGLSISRQLARLLGGDILLKSGENEGSVFTLLLPETYKAQQNSLATSSPLPATPKIRERIMPLIASSPIGKTKKLEETTTDLEENDQQQTIAPINDLTLEDKPISDDRDNIHQADRILLIMEDDRNFINILLELAREKDFKCIVAENGKVGLELVEQYHPHAVILDVGLPKVDGLTVMEKLKDDPKTRHIPVHFISGSEQSVDAKKMGAIGYLLKPVSLSELTDSLKKIESFIAKQIKKLLILTDNAEKTQSIQSLVVDMDATVTTVDTKQAVCQQLKDNQFDCLIIDVGTEANTGIKLLEKLYQGQLQTPIIIYSERELTPEEEHIVQQCETNLTIKSVRSPERLLDEATLFLHQLEENLPQEKQRILRMMHDKESILMGKIALLVDDDIRNTFALATVLEEKDMEVIIAKNGREGLQKLKEQKIDIVLMDIMMPEMDGYEAMRKIRAQTNFRHLPIIALTAKAMKGDKAKCIEAGANDYLAKPVDTDKLISLMRVWLYQ